MLTFSGNLIIAGSAECLFEDYEKARKLFDKDEEKYDIMAINFSGICFKGIVHLASLHADRIPAFLRAAQLDNDRHIHTHTRLNNLVIPEVENDWTAEIPSTSGSSALFGVRVGLRIGYDKIILCGVPLTKGGGFMIHSTMRRRLGTTRL